MIAFLVAFLTGVVAGLIYSRLAQPESKNLRRLADRVKDAENERDRVRAGNGWGVPFRRSRNTSTKSDSPRRRPMPETGFFNMGDVEGPRSDRPGLFGGQMVGVVCRIVRGFQESDRTG